MVKRQTGVCANYLLTPFALFLFLILQLKKKKQAAKRKGIVAEEAEVEAEPAAQPVTVQAVPERGADVTEGGAEKKGVTDAQDSLPVAAVQVEVLEPSELAETEVPDVGDGTLDPVTSCTELSGAIGEPMGEDILPVPPAAPTNGNLRPVVGSRHKKSVSFGVGEAGMGSILDGLSCADRGVEVKAVPPLPPVALGAGGGADADKSHVAYTNETFLRRNFSLSGDPEQV